MKGEGSTIFDRPVREPAYWKALVAALVVLVPLTLFLRLFIRMPAAVWVLLFALTALAMSWSIYTRMRNDWRAGDMIGSVRARKWRNSAGAGDLTEKGHGSKNQPS